MGVLRTVLIGCDVLVVACINGDVFKCSIVGLDSLVANHCVIAMSNRLTRLPGVLL